MEPNQIIDKSLANVLNIKNAPLRITLFLAIIIVLFIVSLLVARYISPWMGVFWGFGYLGVVIIAFISNATVFFPVPSLPFVTVFVTGKSFEILLGVTALYTLGAVVGEIISYIVGFSGRKVVNIEQLGVIQKWRNRLTMDLLVLFIAVQPILPFDALGIFAGNIRYNLGKFFALCFVGRYFKYLMLLYAVSNGLSFFFK